MIRIGSADTLRQNNAANVVRQRLIRYIFDIESHLVNARFVLIVAEFELAFIHLHAVLIGGDIRFCSRCLSDIDKSRALLSDRVSKSVLVAHDVRRGHCKLIDALCNLDRAQIAEYVRVILDELADERRRARHVGRSHGSTRKSVVRLTGDRR